MTVNEQENRDNIKQGMKEQRREMLAEMLEEKGFAVNKNGSRLTVSYKEEDADEDDSLRIHISVKDGASKDTVKFSYEQGQGAEDVKVSGKTVLLSSGKKHIKAEVDNGDNSVSKFNYRVDKDGRLKKGKIIVRDNDEKTEIRLKDCKDGYEINTTVTNEDGSKVKTTEKRKSLSPALLGVIGHSR